MFAVVGTNEGKFTSTEGARQERKQLAVLVMPFSRVFHNSRLIRQIDKKIIDLTKDWTQNACLAVNHSNHYTRMFSVLVWLCN